MLVNEFISRTNYYPSADEWDAINHTYTHDSELDKDEFCRLWVKMNKNKVDEQIAHRKYMENLWNRYDNSYYMFRKYCTMVRNARKDSTREEYQRKADEAWDDYASAREELMELGCLDRCNSANYRDY